jgi:hypothetical protein
MTVNVNDTIERYTVSGVGPYPFSFRIFAETDLQVTACSAATPPVPSLLTYLTHYTVTGANVASGGGVTLTASAATSFAGYTLDIRSNTPQQQPTSIRNIARFLPEIHEDAYDNLGRQTQDLNRRLLASIHFPDNEILSGEVESAAVRKGRYLFWDTVTGAISSAISLTGTVLSQAIFNAFYFLTDGHKRTAAEIAAGVTPTNYAYPVLNLLRYGADPTGVAASNTAMASAIAVCGPTGGTIIVPPGVYLFTGNSSVIDLTSKIGITIQGDGAETSGAQPATRFNFSGTGTGVLISMNSAYGCSIRGIQIRHTSASFTGTYIQCSNTASADPQYCGMYDSTFGDSAGAGTTHLDLGTCINFTAERCSFMRGNPSVKGRAAGSYSNVIAFRDCQWSSNYVAPVRNPGEAWVFQRCSFEPLTTGAPGAVVSTGVTAGVNGIEIAGCWFGDVTSTAGSWVELYGGGLHFHGNMVNGEVTGTTAIKLRQFVGAKIAGNTLASCLNALDFATATSYAVSLENNNFNTVTNIVANPANHALGLVFNPNYPFPVAPPAGHGAFNNDGYEISANGVITQWGNVSIAAVGTTPVSFSKTFPSACFGVVIGYTGAPGTNTATASSITTSGFTAGHAGSAGAATMFWIARGR